MKTIRAWAVHVLVGGLCTVWMMARLPIVDMHFGLAQMIAGTAWRPFVYRVLTPMVIRLLMMLTEVPALAALVAVQWAALTLYSWAAWELAQRRGAAWMMIMAGIVPLTWQMRHIYDAPTMAIWAVALLLLYRRQFYPFLMAYMAACYSKETAIMLVPIFAACEWRSLKSAGWVRMIVTMVILYISIHYTIMSTFAHNPGGDMELHVAEHLSRYPTYIGVLLALGALLGWRWQWQLAEIRATLLVFPVFVYLFLVGGYPGELRVFAEIWPALALALFNTLTWRPNENKSRTILVPDWGVAGHAGAGGGD